MTAKINSEVVGEKPAAKASASDAAPKSRRSTSSRGWKGRERQMTPLANRGLERRTFLEFSVAPGSVKLAALDDPDWARQLWEFLRTYGRAGSADFARKVSEETLRNRRDILFSGVRMLRKDRNLKTLSQIRPKYLPRLFELWDEKGISKRAQINYYSTFRWFWKVCGIHVASIETYAKIEGEFTINRAAEVDKSWTGNGVSFDEVIERIEKIDPVASRLFIAMKTYGLRAKESLRLMPHEDDGEYKLNVSRGTKTGRAREIEFLPFGEEMLRATLDSLKEQVPPGCHLAWQDRTLKQAKKRLEYVCRLAGVTKKDLGVTMHGLRHEWAIENLEKLGGVTAPVRGGSAIDYRKLTEIRRHISRALGHNRVKITGAYYGSFLSQEREQIRRFQQSWERISAVLPDLQWMLQDAGLDNLYMIGARATGTNRSQSERYEFMLPDETDQATALQVAPYVAEIVMKATGLECVVLPMGALPPSQRLLWQAEAIPLFRAVAP